MKEFSESMTPEDNFRVADNFLGTNNTARVRCGEASLPRESGAAV